jgi:hypothetical protein
MNVWGRCPECGGYLKELMYPINYKRRLSVSGSRGFNRCCGSAFSGTLPAGMVSLLQAGRSRRATSRGGENR